MSAKPAPRIQIAEAVRLALTDAARQFGQSHPGRDYLSFGTKSEINAVIASALQRSGIK